MGRLRFSIASLSGLVLVLAVACAALRGASDVWDGVMLSLAFVILLVATLLVVHRAERTRAFWLGFALCGWAYLGISQVPALTSRLLTNHLLVYLDSKVPGRARIATIYGTTTWINQAAAVPGNSGTSLEGFTFATGTQATSPHRSSTILLWDAATGKLLGGAGGTSENFVRIGHTLFALAIAWLGGHLSRWVYVRGRIRREPELASGAGG